MNTLRASALLLALASRADPAWAGGRVCVEAEAAAAVVAPMRVVDAAAPPAGAEALAEASGGKYLEIPRGAGHPPEMTAGEARLTFEIDEPGDYTLWGRVYWLSECNSSFTMCVDDALPFTFGKDATYKAWHWVKAPPRLKQLTLAKGKHVLTIRNRQDGVRLDQVLLVLDKRYVPVGVEDAATR